MFIVVECDGVLWIYLAQDGDRWLVVLNTAVNIRVAYEAENFVTTRATCQSRAALGISNEVCFNRTNRCSRQEETVTC
jgi:hypothetical protein